MASSTRHMNSGNSTLENILAAASAAEQTCARLSRAEVYNVFATSDQAKTNFIYSTLIGKQITYNNQMLVFTSKSKLEMVKQIIFEAVAQRKRAFPVSEELGIGIVDSTCKCLTEIRDFRIGCYAILICTSDCLEVSLNQIKAEDTKNVGVVVNLDGGTSYINDRHFVSTHAGAGDEKLIEKVTIFNLFHEEQQQELAIYTNTFCLSKEKGHECPLPLPN